MAHTIEITRLAGDGSDDADYTVGGSCSSSCEVWRPCEKAWHRHPKNEYGELIEWSTKAVPQEHQFIDGEWMVPSGDCAVQYAYDLGFELEVITELGRYELDLDWDGDGWLADIGDRVDAVPAVIG